MNPLRHFHGIHFRGKTVHVAQTGAIIKLDRQLLKSALAVLKLNGYILGMRLGRFLRAHRPQKTIAFYPQKPGPWYNAWLAARFANFKIIDDYEQADKIFVFDDSTYSDAAKILTKAQRAKALNTAVTDISKTHVEDVFEDIFGYSLKVNPLTYTGLAVQKSNANGTHDGRIIKCPLAPEDIHSESTYQKLIDSTFNGNQSEDLRAAICNGGIPIIFHKYKDIHKRFGTEYARVDIVMATDVFSPQERSDIMRFCDAMGLDFGAIDIMRDKDDGRIYIVDVNKTCMPVLSLSLKEQVQAFRIIAKAFATS